MDINVYTVSELNSYIKSRFDSDDRLISLFVRGEISNYKFHSSGHHYFSIKDADSSIRCVLFKTNAAGLKFRLENGMKVIIYGRVSVYTRDGNYQIYCQKIIPDGAGELQIAFEQLKNRLNEEGLFDSRNKKPIPLFPNRIAVITSPTGAAVRDIINILNKRWPLASVLVVPAIVQGPDAPESVSEALRYVNDHKLADLIITGRGGGSIEDLWAFNTETVCRAIFKSAIPVISAVGHEPDVTISDFVADLRASTPSNAAERAVPDIEDIRNRLEAMQFRFNSATEKMIIACRSDLIDKYRSRCFTDPSAKIRDLRLDLDHLYDELIFYADSSFSNLKNDLNSAEGRLNALNPLAVLSRGYSITVKDGRTVASSAQLHENDVIDIQFADGSAECKVNKVKTGRKQ